MNIKSSLLFSIIASVLLSSCQDKVDLLVHNGLVYTMNNNGTVASSFVVDDGKFIAIGGEELLKKYKAKRVLNLQNLPVYPGLIDSHCHFLKLGLSLQQIDLKGTNSFEEVVTLLKDASEGKQSNSIVGSGWDQNDWEDKSLPNKDRLDELFPDTPVALRRIDGHALLVNQKALDLAGITVDTKVKGGTIIKEDGKLTGVLVDATMQ